MGSGIRALARSISQPSSGLASAEVLAPLALLAVLTLLYSQLIYLAADAPAVSLMSVEAQAAEAAPRMQMSMPAPVQAQPEPAALRAVTMLQEPVAEVEPAAVEPTPAPVAQVVEEVAVASPEPVSEVEMPMFDGRPIRPARQLHMLVTAYSPDEQSCGEWADGITASGYSVWTNGGMLVAADTRMLPFGTLVSIPGYNGGRPVPVLDRGGAIKGNRIDVLYPTHERALQWGVQRLDVTVWEYAD